MGPLDPGSAEAALCASAGASNLAAVSAAADSAGRRRPLRLPGTVGEAALVRAAQRGSSAAVEELFSRHWRPAYRAALLVTGDAAAAEDITQEAFLAALRALPRFDLRRPLKPWLHRIVVNRAIDWSRARAHRAEVSEDAAPTGTAGPRTAARCSARTSWTRCSGWGPSSARSSCCATSWTSRRARSPRRSTAARDGQLAPAARPGRAG